MSLWDRFRFSRRETFAVPAAPAADTRIVSLERSVFGGVAGGMQRINPDDLAGKKGLSIYAKMRHDEQVKAACVFVRDAILSRGWAFEFDAQSQLSDDEKALRARVMEQMIEGMAGAFVDSLNVISTGREYGYSMTEKVYHNVEVDGKQYVGLKSLLGRDPETFNFYTDPYGELQRVEQVAAGQRVEIDLAKFVHYVHNPEFDRYFGRSDLREAYRSWYAKNELLKMWLAGAEKLGGGMLVASIAPDANIQNNSTAYTQLQQVLSTAKSASAVLLPPGVTATVIFPQNLNGFREAVEYFDLAIAKALLVPNLLGVSNAGQTGSFSQSQTQLESFAWRLKADADRLEACLNDQLFKDLGDLNWGDGQYPWFTFKPLSSEALRYLIDTWTKLIGAGAVIPTEIDEQRLREILEMPPREEGDKTLAEVKMDTMPAPLAGAAGEQATDDESDEEDENEAEDEDSEEEEPAAQDMRRFALTAREARLALASARERVDFAVIDRKQATMAATLAGDLSLAVARSVQRLLGDDANLAALTDDDPSDIASVELQGVDVGRMKTQFQKALADAWAMGRAMAQREIRKLGKREAFVRNAAHFADLRDKAAQFFEANSFRMAGNVADGVRALIQAELQNSVKFGRSPEQTREAIWTRLVSKGFSSREAARTIVEGGPSDAGILRALDALDLDTEEQAAHYLDTLSRTNLFESMNEARYAEYTDPALDGFVVALRYSAILDERTTQVCEHLHDKVFRTDSETWDEYRPPNHFNCRSVLIPITQIDVQDGLWDGTESDEPSIAPQEGFK